jgi:hypothetical protein
LPIIFVTKKIIINKNKKITPIKKLKCLIKNPEYVKASIKENKNATDSTELTRFKK